MPSKPLSARVVFHHMRLTDDLTSSRAIYLKGWLFLVLGVIAALTLVAIDANWQVAILLPISIWAFCRWYYFMFYVIEHYVDPGFRFSSLTAFLRYLRSQRHIKREE